MALKKRTHPLTPILWFNILSEEQLVVFTTPNITDENEARARALPLTNALETATLRDGTEEEDEGGLPA